MDKPKKVMIFGPQESGKTTLLKTLEQTKNACRLPEFEETKKFDVKFDYRVVAKALKIKSDSRMVFQVWDTPSDIKGNDIRNIIRNKINTSSISKA